MPKTILNNKVKKTIELENKINIPFNDELKEMIMTFKKTYKEDIKGTDPTDLSELYDDLRDEFSDNKMFKVKNTKPNMFAMSCLFICNDKNIKNWGDVIPYLRKRREYTIGYDRDGLQCCCGKDIKNYIILKNRKKNYNLILGTDCAKKYKIINKKEYNEIKNQQTTLRDQKKKHNNKVLKNRKKKDSKECLILLSDSDFD